MSILNYQIENNALSHAYILESPNHNYNLSYAKDFAHKIFAAKNIYLEDDLNPDLYTIDKEGEVIDIETIRKLIKDITLRPQNGVVKVYIIHNAHNMRTEGANALLKTIEELKEYNIVIFTTTNSNQLLPTIRSRCQLIKLSSNKEIENIDMDKLSSILAKVYTGDIASFYKEKKFFDQYKDDESSFIEAINDIFEYIIYFKYEIDSNIDDNIAYNVVKMASISFDKIDQITDLLHKIKIGFRNNINYDLAIEQIIFAIYRGGMKL